jgi:hypothetical protein
MDYNCVMEGHNLSLVVLPRSEEVYVARSKQHTVLDNSYKK